MSTCGVFIVLDFDSIGCRLEEGHDGPHRDIGEGGAVVWARDVEETGYLEYLDWLEERAR